MESALANYLLNLELGSNEAIARATNGIGPDYDYSKAGKLDGRGHSSDAGKLPWHPTFSTQSKYSTNDNLGGTWGEKYNSEGRLVQTYTPSHEMIRSNNTAGLAEYMVNQERGTELLVPAPYNRKILGRSK